MVTDRWKNAFNTGSGCTAAFGSNSTAPMTSPAMDVPKAQTDLGSDSVSAHDYAGILVPGLPLVVIDTVPVSYTHLHTSKIVYCMQFNRAALPQPALLVSF